MYTPFKLKSGNKPSMAQLSGVSPMKEMVDKGAGKGKVNPFSAEYKRMTKSQRRKKYNTRNEDGSFDKTKDTFKKIGSGKTGKIGNVGETVQNLVKSVTSKIKNNNNNNNSSNNTTTGKVNWKTAPAVGTKARTKWYQENNLKLDDTTPALMKKK